MVLALMLASAGPAPSAQAAPRGDVTINISLTATQVGVPHTICVGDRVEFRVQVIRTVVVDNLIDVVMPLPAVEVSATVFGGTGSITPSTATISSISAVPGSATFTFKAEEVGVAGLVFSAQVDPSAALGVPFLGLGGNRVSAASELTVEDCTYRVRANSRWRVPGEAHITITATIDIAGMVEESDGRYRGTARVQWRAFAGAVGDCSGTLTPESQAEVRGIINNVGDLSVEFEYQTATLKLVVDCGEAGGTRDIRITPQSVLDTVAIEGGSIQKLQSLNGPQRVEGRLTGSVTRITGK
jgi:hypothetical protein